MKHSIHVLSTLLFILLCVQMFLSPAKISQAQVTLPSTIEVYVYALADSGAIAQPVKFCSPIGPNSTPFGCTVKSDAPYPYASNPVTISIEGDYLPDVVGKETNPEQGFTNSVALRSQAIAARSYAYWHIAQGNTIDNSINKQVFIPYQFDRLGYAASLPTSTIPSIAVTENACTAITAPEQYKREQALICRAIANPQYMTLSGSTSSAQTEFSADWPDGVIPVSQSVPKVDPISGLKTEPCGVAGVQYEAPALSHGRGMTQLGANRWARGNRCGTDSLGFVPWSTQFTSPAQILTHYYTGIHIRNVSNQQPVAANNRWVPLQFNWGSGAVKPPVFVPGSSYTNLSVTVQNTGIAPWACSPTNTYQLGYRWVRLQSSPSLFALPLEIKPGAAANRVSLCNLGVGQSATYTFTINDVPAWAGSTGAALYFDVYQRNTTTNVDVATFNRPATGMSWPEYVQPIRICATSTCPRQRATRDIVFVVDGTGFMALPMWELRNNATAVVDSIVNSGDDYRFAIVEYEDDPIPGLTPNEAPSRIVLNFTSDRTQILNAINSIQTIVVEGGPFTVRNTVFSGVMTASSLPWRATADKTILLYGNAPPHDPELDPQGNLRFSRNAVIAATRGTANSNGAAWSSPIHIDAIPINDGVPFWYAQTQTEFQTLSVETMGTFRPAPNSSVAVDELLNTFNETIQSPYADAGEPYSAALGSPITLQAPRSFDPDGLISRYEWDLNNDGVFEETTASPQLVYTYAQPYTGPITVRVTDDAGNISSDTTNVRVEVGMEPVSFASETPVSGIFQSRAVASGDLNSDGILDVVSARSLVPELQIALGTGLGTFGTPSSLNLSSTPVTLVNMKSIAVGDVNNDQKLDIIAWGRLVLGNGDGTFQPPTTINAGDPALLAGINGDSNVDIVSLSGNQLLLQNGQGNGTFQTAASYSVGNQASALVVRDVNRDGWADVAVTNQSDNTVSILLNNGSGGLLPRVNYSAGTNPSLLDSWDINNDEIMDLVISGQGSQTVNILLGNSNGTFQAATTLSVGVALQSLSIARMDSDSFGDLVLTTDNQVRVLLGNGNGTFQTARTFSISGSSSGVALADYNRDGITDIGIRISGLSLLLSTITISPNPPTPTPTATSIPTNTPTATATPAGSATLVSDSFSRTVSNGWGSAAPQGGYYALPSSNVSNYAVSGGVGKYTIPISNTARELILNGTGSPSAQDVDITVRVAVDKLPTGSGADVLFGFIARQVGVDNRYRGQLRVRPDGTLQVYVQKQVAGALTQPLASTTVSGVTIGAGDWIRVRMQATGLNPTTIRIRAWKDGTSEPSTWAHTVTDPEPVLQTAGYLSLRVQANSALTNAPIEARFDDWVVTNLAGSGATSTPTATPVGPTATPTRTPTPTATPTPGGSGPIAAYNFNATSGTTLADRAGTNIGTLVNGPTWTTQGKNAGALSFDGTNDIVTIPDANALDLTTGMTLEAWVYPTQSNSWRPIIFKAQSSGLCYALYGNTGDTNRPRGYIYRTAEVTASGTATLPVNTWSHLAVTYDGSNLRFYLNGTLVATQAITGPIVTSTNGLSLGGNTVWNEFFVGRIDDVRIYNRALSASEIVTDRDTPVP